MVEELASVLDELIKDEERRRRLVGRAQESSQVVEAH